MRALPLAAALWLASLRPAAALGRADLEEVFSILLAHSGFDAGRPAPTKLVFVPPRKERGVLAEASASFVEAEPLNLLTICRTRGQAAFILGHELAHLVHRDNETLDRFTQELADDWFRKNAAKPASRFAEETRNSIEAFLRATEDRADETSQRWLSETVDPKTGAVFGADAAAQALELVREWREARRLPLRAASYASLEDRIAAAESRNRKSQDLPSPTLDRAVGPRFDGR